MSKPSRGTLKQLFNQQSGACPYCGKKMTLSHDKENSATIEHIIPKSRGGTNARDNLMAACNSCNNARGSKPLAKWLLQTRYGVYL